jgi:hypothetical protein
MELKVHMEEMLKRLPRNATYRSLANVSEDSIEKLAEQGSANASGAVYVGGVSIIKRL